MEERQFKGIWIPKEIWLAKELTIQEKVVLVEIDSLETEDKGCYASNKYFSNFFQLTTQRVSQIIKQLEDKKYIKINYITKNKQIIERQLRIQKPPYPEVSNILDRGIKYSLGGYQENFKENNINKNNINKKEIYKEKKFQKPTLKEVQEYCRERNNNVDADLFINYYESNGWKVGKNSMKDWKACVRTWERNKINQHKETRFEREQRLLKEMLEDEES